MAKFTSHGGAIDQTAVIGHPPEHRNWQPGDDIHEPDIHPTARIEAFCSVDAGMKIPTRIGAHTWLLKHVHVGHDAWIGDNCEISTGAIIGGHVTIGHNVQIKLGAIIKPGVTIGEGALIGAGAVVIRDVAPGEVHAGVPARQLPVRSDAITGV